MMISQNEFPRTMVGGVSLPRLLIGTNWFLGYSHATLAKDKFIKDFQTRERIAAVLNVFLEYGIDAVMGPLSQHLEDSVCEAEQRSGQRIIRIYTPAFDLSSSAEIENTAEAVFDQCAAYHATFCMPHQSVTDALVDRRAGVIRDLDRYTGMIRERGMIPGLSTHMPEAVIYADAMGADVETYIQIYNAAGFLMQVEADWVMRVIRHAQKPVMTIKPFAAGKLLPVVGLAFVWNTIRDQDMVTAGTTTPDEAREVIELSLDLLDRQVPDNALQTTRSKKSLQ
ncbi:MAG TPA: hypothetical protein VFR47_22300 [Anaerolineales bacterium]|nr:hypothetical protein [Anaerolineales bacterium]